jgi:hypothetical protein
MLNFKQWLKLSEGLWDGSGRERKVQGLKKPSDGWPTANPQGSDGGAAPAAAPAPPPKQMKKSMKK